MVRTKLELVKQEGQKELGVEELRKPYSLGYINLGGFHLGFGFFRKGFLNF